MSACRRGIRAIAIHHDSLEAAVKARRDVWGELENLEWELLIVGPEMLSNSRIRELMRSAPFRSTVGFVVIDEVHLVSLWGETFREDYNRITQLRSLLPSDVTWLAMSATVEATHERPKLQAFLGFKSRYFHDVRIAVDRPEIYYRVVTLDKPLTGNDFPQFAHLLPPINGSAQDIDRILIAFNTIAQVTQFLDWYDREAKHRV